MIGGAQSRSAAADLATRIDEIGGREQLATLVALIAARIDVRTVRALAAHKAVGEKPVTRTAVQLLDSLLIGESISMKTRENVLRNSRLQRRRRAAKMIECHIEPCIDILMNRIVFVANGLRRRFLFHRFRFRRRSVFVSATKKVKKK
jgi:hypothetical protein